MKSTILALLAALLSVSSPSASASELIYSQFSDNQSTFGPSQLWSPNNVNSEIADEFNVTGNIDRVSAGGFVWGAIDFQGVYVRFYEFGADNKPGALQHEYFFPAGDPHLTFDQVGNVDVTLSPAFAASGRHFLSVQAVCNYWYWWSSSSGAPRGEAFYFRNNAIGEGWHHGDNLNTNVNADVVFDLYGTVTGTGVITSLSENTLPRSGFLQIFGNNFGGDGTVLIGGISAPVADWTSTRIVAYVPENAPLTTLNVQVMTGPGASNTVPLTVTARPAPANHVNWRFRMNGPYSFVRPAIGSDGTVYSIDKFSHLYALTPDGGLKWLARGAGDKGVAVGPDDTIYVASESFIKAYNPDGSPKWTFVQEPRAFICVGVSVGPDGNIYSVGTHGMGVFSLTPSGTLRWTNTELYRRPIVDYGEIVFGPNGSNYQLYFYANDHLRALTLDGSSVFTNSSGIIGQLKPGMQPVVSPADASVHTVLWSYSPAGSLLWFFQTPYPFNVFTPADIGSDGTHYFVQNLSQLFALNADGSQRWHTTVNGYVDGPVVDPFNSQLVMGSQETGDHAGYMLSVNAQNGQELWRVILPIEDPTVWNPGVGIYGFNQFVDTRGRFTEDGQTVYFTTYTATGDNDTSKSFVYSLYTGTGGTPTPTPTPMQVAISGTVSSCTAPSPGPIANISLTLTGPGSSSTSTNGQGNYMFSSLASGMNYTVTASKEARLPGSQGVNTVDILLAQSHFLRISLLLGYRLTAADVNNDGFVTTVDVIAIQRFFLGLTSGTANVGKYSFSPANRTYSNPTTNQTGQNYAALIFGDINGDTSFPADGPGLGSLSSSPTGQTSSASGLSGFGEALDGLTAEISLPRVGIDATAVDKSINTNTAAVTSTAIAAKNRLVGFQGDLIFDERMITFESEPVQKAGLTGGDWNVSGNVLAGPGPIRTLRISAFSNDFTPLSGTGTLFELRMKSVSRTPSASIELVWAQAPGNFVFIRSNFEVQSPSNALPDSVTQQRSSR